MDRQCLYCQQSLSFNEAVRGELFCSMEHRERYLQAPSAALSHESLMRVVERIKSRRVAAQAASATPEPVRHEKIRFPIPQVEPRRIVQTWTFSGIAASVVILALGATFFESNWKGVHSFSPLVLAAESQVNRVPEVPMPPQALPPATSAVGDHTRHISIRAKNTSWLAVCSDGKEVLRTMLSPGDAREIEFLTKAIVRTGNAGGTDISVDGKPVGSIGPAGALRVIELGNQGFRLLSLGSGDVGNDCGNR